MPSPCYSTTIAPETVCAIYTDADTNHARLSAKYGPSRSVCASIRAGRSHRRTTLLLPNPRRSKRRLDTEMIAAIRQSTESVRETVRNSAYGDE
jgi:hypothetical protein